jgi:hypothetical protein
MDTQCALCEVGTEYLNIIEMNYMLQTVEYWVFKRYKDLSLTKITPFVMANEVLLFAED